MVDSRAGSAATSLASEAQFYSTLEVDHSRLLENDINAAPILLHNHGNEKIPGYEDGKIRGLQSNGKEVLAFYPVSPSLESATSKAQRKFCGLKSKPLIILFTVVLVFITAGAIGGSVGGYLVNQKKNKGASPASKPASTPTATQTGFANTGLAALQWTDPDGTSHKRLYYQDKNDMIRESAWDNSKTSDSAWKVSTISNAVQPGTPITVTAGRADANVNNTLTMKVYVRSPDEDFHLWEAPADGSNSWSERSFVGSFYPGTNSTYLATYWIQDIRNQSQDYIILYQGKKDPNSLKQGHQVTNRTGSYPWVSEPFGVSQRPGATFALANMNYRDRKHLMLYTIDDGEQLQQHDYKIGDVTDGSEVPVPLNSRPASGISMDPQAPLAVAVQDNQPLYRGGTLPECAREAPLTHLLVYPALDGKSLMLKAWNCTTGFLDRSSELSFLQRPNRTFLSVTAMTDTAAAASNVFMLYDGGLGPQVAQLVVPKQSGDSWTVDDGVKVDFGL